MENDLYWKPLLETCGEGGLEHFVIIYYGILRLLSIKKVILRKSEWERGNQVSKFNNNGVAGRESFQGNPGVPNKLSMGWKKSFIMSLRGKVFYTIYSTISSKYIERQKGSEGGECLDDPPPTLDSRKYNNYGKNNN